MELSYADQQHIIRTWLSKVGITNRDWENQDSLTSPNWCDNTTWPVSTADSTWEMTAKSIAYPGVVDPPDDKIVIIPRAYVRFMAAVIHVGGDMEVKYLADGTVVGTHSYAGRYDFTKRAKRRDIKNASDSLAGQTGDEWEIVLDFLEDGKPIILVPFAMSSVENRLPDTLISKIKDDVTYKNSEGNPGGFAFVRYPGVQIYSAV
jgi:hypothetical protein